MYDDAEDEFFQSQGYPSQTKRSRPVVVAIVASAITTIVVFFSLRELESIGVINGPRTVRTNVATSAIANGAAVQVPSVLGVSLDQGRELLKGRGLLLSIAEERDDAAHAAGTILLQNPLAGSETPPGTTVQLVVAKAATSLIIPPVAGQKIEDATAFLTSRGFKIGPNKAVAAPQVAPGLVAGTEPAAGASIATGAAISLLVSEGKAVPNVVGKSLTRAKKLLEDAGFKVGRTHYKYDPCCGEYIILEQTPAGEQAAAAGTVIDLVVNEPG